jgi:CheY-like chemotaxis protein
MAKPVVLIVEDDPQLNLIFSLTLKSDFEIVPISDGGKALEYLQSNVPGMIVLDLNLPGASGKEILDTVRSHERLKVVRVILATADATMADELASEVDLVLLKPISTNQLRTLAARIGN